MAKKELKNYSLGSIDLKKVATHLGVYFLGAGLIGALQYLLSLDLGPYSAVVALMAGALIDVIRKVIDGTKE